MESISPAEALTAHTILIARLIKSLDLGTQGRLNQELYHAIAELRHDPQAPQNPGVSNEKVANLISSFAKKIDHPE